MAEYEEHTFSSESKQSHAVRLAQEFEAHLAEAQTKTNEAKLKFERAARLVENANAGIKHIFSKLDSINVNESLKAGDNEDNILELCAMKLETIVKNTQGKELAETSIQTQQPGEQANILQVNTSMLPTFNTRVKLRAVEFEDETVDEEEENDDEYGDVPDRETIKRHTALMLNSRLKTKQSKKIKKKRESKEEEEA